MPSTIDEVTPEHRRAPESRFSRPFDEDPNTRLQQLAAMMQSDPTAVMGGNALLMGDTELPLDY